MEEIDFVVTWVDDTDLKWLERKYSYENQDNDNIIMQNDMRYRDYDTFKYWFRSIEKYAPWVRKIFLVTEGHLPQWINVDHPKLVLVKHSDFMPKEYLPTFSINPIELNFHRIKGLSEKFVYFNDDFFLNTSVNPKDFFYKDKPRDFGIFTPVIPDSEFSKILFNNTLIINKYFDKNKIIKSNFRKFFSLKYKGRNLRNCLMLPYKKIPGMYNHHLPSSFLKSTYEKLWEIEFDLLNEISTHKFRESSDINQYLFKYWQVLTGEFEPQHSNYGKYVSIDNMSMVKKITSMNKYKTICINDDTENVDFDEVKQELIKIFNKKFPNKSEFEI